MTRAGLPHRIAEGTYPRHRLPRSNVLFLLVLLVGCALLTAGPQIPDGAEPWRGLTIGLGEAFVVASVLGFAVERPLRRVFARGVARDVFLTSFGINAPRDYVAALQSVLNTERLSQGVSWEIRIDWADRAADMLKLTIDLSVSVTNIGGRPIEPAPLWIMASSEGSGGTRALRFQSEISDSDGRRVHRSAVLDESELARLHAGTSSTSAQEPLVLPAASLLGPAVMIPPGGRETRSATGEVFLTVPGILPLVQRTAAMDVEVCVTGPALDDVRVDVRTGVDTLPVGHQDARSKCFSSGGLALPGSALLIELRPRARQSP